MRNRFHIVKKLRVHKERKLFTLSTGIHKEKKFAKKERTAAATLDNKKTNDNYKRQSRKQKKVFHL